MKNKATSWSAAMAFCCMALAGCAQEDEWVDEGTVDQAKAAGTSTCTYGDGLYCGANGVPGDPNTLYSCIRGRVTVEEVCAGGCQAMPPGVNDVCVTGNVEKALDYAMQLVGGPYVWWTSGPLGDGPPAWAKDAKVPEASHARSKGMFCAGLTNLMLRKVGKEIPHAPGAFGGTVAYGLYYKKVAKKFDANASYPAGTLVGRYFRSVKDQGHVAVVLGDGRVLESNSNRFGSPYPGVNTSKRLKNWRPSYYEYAVLPEDWLGK
ncbi:MAG: C40 family peptidase [Deltaproteobacteria bacterium]|nr:C40 family peptidase [Deltaproteobacteria bacterium]